MPRLKDYLANDMDTFLNLDEFADTHIIDSQEMPAVVDEDVLKERPRYGSDRSFPGDGVYLGELVLFVRLADIGYRPVSGQHLWMDNKLYQVAECSETNGMLEITLEANKA